MNEFLYGLRRARLLGETECTIRRMLIQTERRLQDQGCRTQVLDNCADRLEAGISRDLVGGVFGGIQHPSGRSSGKIRSWNENPHAIDTGEACDGKI